MFIAKIFYYVCGRNIADFRMISSKNIIQNIIFDKIWSQCSLILKDIKGVLWKKVIILFRVQVQMLYKC